MPETTYAKGLEGVIAAESEICQIDGANGKLYYRGYSIEDLAAHSSFEETTYLLLNEHLPTKQELEDFAASMRKSRGLAQPVRDMIRSFPPATFPLQYNNSSIMTMGDLCGINSRIFISASSILDRVNKRSDYSLKIL